MVEVVYLQEPKLGLTADFKKAYFLEDYSIEIDGIRIDIDAGFSGNASTPSFFTNLVPKIYRTALAALVHDAVYGKKKWHYGLTRQQCDEAFYWILVDYGFSKTRAALALTAVRSAGWWYWERNKLGVRKWLSK